ncbi:MAG: hypothetical protein AB7P33_08425 [Dehalococcoidia bacterium]
MPPVDPNDVIITGENSFIRLSSDGSSVMSTRTSHWRVLWCPDGSGHTLFIQSELTGDAPRIYTDNVAVTRWLQQNIETYLFAAFADTSLPTIEARFARDGDPRGDVRETIDGGGDAIVMTWSDCIDPFVLTIPPGTPPERPIGVFSTFFPARSASVSVNGKLAAGAPVAEKRGDRDSSSSCLAWSETWVKPRG